MKTQLAAIVLATSMAMPLVYGEEMTPKTHSDASKVNPNATAPMPMRASQFIGTDIYNNDNASLGEVEDIVLDGGHSQISYVAVSYGGLLGIGDKLFAVPYPAFKFRPVDKGKVYLDINKDTLKNQQGFDKNNWPDINNADTRKQMMDLYHVSPTDMPRSELRSDRVTGNSSANPDVGTNRPGTAAGNNSSDATRTNTNPGGEVKDTTVAGANNNAPMKDGLVWSRRYSQLKGANIINRADEKLGDIYDVVFDAHSGKVNYVVLQRGGVMGIGDKLFAVPADSLISKQGEEKLVLDISVDRFKNAPGFDQNRWPDFADPTLKGTYDQFYNQQQTSAAEQR